MSEFKLFMWMLFATGLACLGIVAFGDEQAQEIASGVLGGTFFLGLVALFGRGMS